MTGLALTHTFRKSVNVGPVPDPAQHDRAMQVHGGMGYSRHKPFEHIYRHHRRYRITEGSEEIQKRKVAGFLFGYMGAGKH